MAFNQGGWHIELGLTLTSFTVQCTGSKYMIGILSTALVTCILTRQGGTDGRVIRGEHQKKVGMA